MEEEQKIKKKHRIKFFLIGIIFFGLFSASIFGLYYYFGEGSFIEKMLEKRSLEGFLFGVGTSIFFEDCSSPPASLSDTWTITGSGNSWQYGSGAEANRCWSEQTTSTMITTNSLDLTSYTSANLSFDWDCDGTDGGEGMTVYVNSSSESWIELLALTNGNNAGASVEYDLGGAGLSMTTGVNLRADFFASANNEDCDWDNINVTGFTTAMDNGNVTVTLINSTDFNVTNGTFFKFFVNVSCSDANCGEVNVTLDPLSTKSPIDISPNNFETYKVTIDNGLKISYEDWFITFQPYFVMNNGQVYTWNQIPSSIEKNLWKKQISPTKYKYGVDFDNVSQNIRDNLKYVVLHRSEVENLTWNDINISGNSIIIKEEIILSHKDLLRDYSIIKINRTDIVIGDIQGKNVTVCEDPSMEINCSQVFKDNFIPNGDGTYFITFDPTITLIGDTSYDSIDNNITQETGFAHLNISTTAPYDSLVLYMPFDSNVSDTIVYDYSGNNNDGTLNGNPVFNSSGFIGGAYEFDGTGDYIDCEDLGVSEDKIYSFTAWVKTTETGIDNWIVSEGSTTSSAIIGLINQDGVNRAMYRTNAGTENNVFGTVTINDGVWHFLVVTANGTTLSLYTDGVIENSLILSGGTTTVDVCGIGRLSRGSPCCYSNATLDEVMIFDIALTASEISDIYNNQSARFFSQGIQLFNNTNVSGDGTENRLNISIANYQHFKGSNISVSVGGDFFNISDDGTINNLEFTTDPNFLNITFKYLADTNQFYSPLIIGNITLESWTEGVGVLDKGIIPEDAGNPFYVDSSYRNNPFTIPSLNQDESIIINWSIFVNGTIGNIYKFFAFANSSSSSNISGIVNVEIVEIVAPSDTCSPSSPLTGNYQFECSDNCVQSTVLESAGYDISFNGSGTFTASSNINNIGNWFVRTGCQVIINSGVRFGIWVTFIKDISLIW